MHSSYAPFLIEVTFNLTLVDDSAWAVGGSWKNNNVDELILSACPWSPMMLSHLSLQPFSPIQNVEAEIIESLPALDVSSSGPASRYTSSIVRGRDLPFPAVPVQRRRTLQAPPSNLRNSALLEQRYSSAVLPPLPTTNDDAPTRGRTLRRTTRPTPTPTRPALSRSDSRTLSPESAEEMNSLSRRMSKNSTLLREPPFPLPHRVLQRPASLSRVQGNKEPRPVSKRMSSIPPPLALENIYAQRLDELDEGEDSPVLGREEARRLMQRRVLVPPVVRGRRCSASRGPQNI